MHAISGLLHLLGEGSRHYVLSLPIPGSCSVLVLVLESAFPDINIMWAKLCEGDTYTPAFFRPKSTRCISLPLLNFSLIFILWEVSFLHTMAHPGAMFSVHALIFVILFVYLDRLRLV